VQAISPTIEEPKFETLQNPLIAKLLLSEIKEEEQLKQQIKRKTKSRWKNLELFLRVIYKRYLLEDKDCMILITGDKGDGKSSLILRMGLIWHKITGKPFTLRNHITYTKNPQEIKEKLFKLKQSGGYQFVGHDEAARFLLGEDWAKKESKELKKVFAEIRTAHLIQAFACPFKIKRVDSKYIESLFHFWIHIFDRDKAVIFRKNKNPGAEAYDLKIFDKIKFVSPNPTNAEWLRILSKLRRSPNFYATIRWGKIPTKVYSSYLKYREKAVWKFGDPEASKKEEEKEGEAAKKLRQIITKQLKKWLDNGKSLRSFRRKFGLDYSENTLKEWLAKYEGVNYNETYKRKKVEDPEEIVSPTIVGVIKEEKADSRKEALKKLKKIKEKTQNKS